MNWWPFGKKRRQQRYTINTKRDVNVVDLVIILQKHPLVLSARQMNKLPPQLQGYFKAVSK